MVRNIMTSSAHSAASSKTHVVYAAAAEESIINFLFCKKRYLLCLRSITRHTDGFPTPECQNIPYAPIHIMYEIISCLHGYKVQFKGLMLSILDRFFLRLRCVLRLSPARRHRSITVPTPSFLFFASLGVVCCISWLWLSA